MPLLKASIESAVGGAKAVGHLPRRTIKLAQTHLQRRAARYRPAHGQCRRFDHAAVLGRGDASFHRFGRGLRISISRSYVPTTALHDRSQVIANWGRHSARVPGACPVALHYAISDSGRSPGHGAWFGAWLHAICPDPLPVTVPTVPTMSGLAGAVSQRIPHLLLFMI